MALLADNRTGKRKSNLSCTHIRALARAFKWCRFTEYGDCESKKSFFELLCLTDVRSEGSRPLPSYWSLLHTLSSLVQIASLDCSFRSGVSCILGAGFAGVTSFVLSFLFFFVENK